MRSFIQKKFHNFQASATALGGQIHEPLGKIILPQAPVSLPAVGGFATAREGAFNLDEIVRFSSAYTLVTGREVTEESGADPAVQKEGAGGAEVKGPEVNVPEVKKNGGSYVTLATAVVEDFNLLEVVTAKRIVAQIVVTTPGDGGPQRISFGVSRFEGLRVAGRDATLRPNAALWSPTAATGERGWPTTWSSFQGAVAKQAGNLAGLFDKHPDEDAIAWAKNRHGWDTDATATGGGGTYSLFDGCEDPPLPGAYGHLIEVPDFGRVHFGEVFISPSSVQYVSIRVDLGCPICGQVTGPTTQMAGGGGKGNKH